MNTREDNPWLDKNCMSLVMITKRNSDDGENLYYKGYRLYQDDWEPCAGKVYNLQGDEIAAWNGYCNYYEWTGTDADMKVLSNLIQVADDEYMVSGSMMMYDDTGSLEEIEEPREPIKQYNPQPLYAVMAFCWIFILLFSILVLGGE